MDFAVFLVLPVPPLALSLGFHVTAASLGASMPTMSERPGAFHHGAAWDGVRSTGRTTLAVRDSSIILA